MVFHNDKAYSHVKHDRCVQTVWPYLIINNGKVPNEASLATGKRLNKNLMGLDVTKPVFGVSTKRDSNQSPQLRNFACSKFRFDTFQKAINKGADQSEWMHRLICAFVVQQYLHIKAMLIKAKFYKGIIEK